MFCKPFARFILENTDVACLVEQTERIDLGAKRLFEHGLAYQFFFELFEQMIALVTVEGRDELQHGPTPLSSQVG